MKLKWCCNESVWSPAVSNQKPILNNWACRLLKLKAVLVCPCSWLLGDPPLLLILAPRSRNKSFVMTFVMANQNEFQFLWCARKYQIRKWKCTYRYSYTIPSLLLSVLDGTGVLMSILIKCKSSHSNYKTPCRMMWKGFSIHRFSIIHDASTKPYQVIT